MVHVIGDTLFPVPVGNVFDVLENCTSFSKFREYVLKAGLDTELKNPSELNLKYIMGIKVFEISL